MKQSHVLTFLLYVLSFTLLFGSTEVYADCRVFYHAPRDHMKIALTFDDGPHPKLTPKILEILKKYDVKATFFVVGSNVEYYSSVLPQIIADGHEIGNHTYSHKTVQKASTQLLNDEIAKTSNIIANYADGYRVKLFRPPCGCLGDNAKAYCEKNGYSVVLWSIDTRDWSHRNADDIVKEVTRNVTSGDIILMHDYIAGYTPTPEVLERLLPVLIDAGYEFCTVSELINS